MLGDTAGVLIGLSELLHIENLVACLCGVMLGMASGVLPGIGPAVMMAMLLPFTFGMAPVTAAVLLASVYNGAQHGAGMASILASSSDGPASGGTAADGRLLAWQGDAGRAIAISAVSSMAAVVIGTSILAVIGPWLAKFALSFGPAEYFSLVFLTLAVTISIGRGSFLTSFGMICFGLLLGLVGVDLNTGQLRLTFGQAGLLDGIGILVVAIGTFAIGETIAQIGRHDRRGVVIRQIQSLLPSGKDIGRATPSILRGSLLGSLFGLLPGGGSGLASFGAYEIERRLSRGDVRVGQGAIEGVAAPAAASKVGLQSSFLTLLAFGIPSNAALAIMLSALQVQGLMAGPTLIVQQPALFWSLIICILLGTAMLLVVNVFLTRAWIRIIEVPYIYLYPGILGLCALSVYSVNSSTFDLYLACVFGLLGYVFRKLDCNPTPMLMGFVLVPIFEQQFRSAMLLAKGEIGTFLTRPASAGMLAISLLVVALFAILKRSNFDSAVSD